MKVSVYFSVATKYQAQQRVEIKMKYGASELRYYVIKYTTAELGCQTKRSTVADNSRMMFFFAWRVTETTTYPRANHIPSEIDVSRPSFGFESRVGCPIRTSRIAEEKKKKRTRLEKQSPVGRTHNGFAEWFSDDAVVTFLCVLHLPSFLFYSFSPAIISHIPFQPKPR